MKFGQVLRVKASAPYAVAKCGNSFELYIPLSLSICTYLSVGELCEFFFGKVGSNL